MVQHISKFVAHRFGIMAGLCAATFLSGCGGPNPCGAQAGGMCVDSRSIYGVTNTRDQINPDQITQDEQKKAQSLLDSPASPDEQLPNIDSPTGGGGGETGGGGTPGPSAQMIASGSPNGSLGAALEMPQPILTQPQVMRVWVAPWIDTDGTLHWPGYSFVVVKREEWRFGAPEVQQSSVLTPLQVDPAVGMPASDQSGDNAAEGSSPTNPPAPPPASPGIPSSAGSP